MKSKVLCTLLALWLAALLACDAALAKRMGGGGSFGSKSSYSRSYTPSPSQPASPTSPTRQATPAPSTPPSVGQTPAPQGGGMFSRMGWGLGGFMAGGLLGSMLFGGSGWGAGGGGGIGFIDILLLGLIAYFGYRLIRGRFASPKGPTPSDLRPPADGRTTAQRGWDALRSDTSHQTQPGSTASPMPNPTGGFGVAPGAASGGAQADGPTVPDGFNTQEFIEGAKTVYARLQHSWDRRDLNDIALFTTPEVLAEIRRQAAADPAPSKTELLLVNAKLLEFREDEADIVATVLFDVLLREDAAEERPKQVREVWHFARPAADLSANWRLEGIQQLEA